MPISSIAPSVASYTARPRGIESQQNLGRKLAVNALPLVGVGGAMAASAWLPANNPFLGFAVLGVEIFLGAFALVRLLSLAKN